MSATRLVQRSNEASAWLRETAARREADPRVQAFLATGAHAVGPLCPERAENECDRCGRDLAADDDDEIYIGMHPILREGRVKGFLIFGLCAEHARAEAKDGDL